MSFTQKNQLLIAFKKLYGKSHTSAIKGIFNENIASSIQLGFDKIFGQTIPTNPSSSLYSNTNNIVEKIKFNLVGDSDSIYTNTIDSISNTSIEQDGETATGGVHAYKLVLPANYESNTTNPKVGTGAFINSTTASDSNGTLQLVPTTFGSIYGIEVSSSSGIIGPLDNEDYFFDYYSGILFIQDIIRTPTAVTAYMYIGDYADQSISKGYKRLRYQASGTFDVDGHAEINLPTTVYGKDAFPTASFNYITVDVQIKEDGRWTNNLLSVQTVITGSSNELVGVILDAAALDNTNEYRLVAVNEDPNYYVIS